MKMRVAVMFVAAVALSSLACGADPPEKLPDWGEASVMLTTESGTGSGVAFRNGKYTFVWTDAHVVESCEHIDRVIDPATGHPVVRVRYDELKAVREKYIDGRKVGASFSFAQVVRYSDAKKGHDLALLRLRDPDFIKTSVSFADYTPKAGVEVWHVGSSGGTPGHNTVSSGVFSTAGRLRHDFRHNDTDPMIYDQVSVSCIPGSSGAGVFDPKTGACVGLITDGLGGSEGLNFITPARRLREFAKKASCEWAVNVKVEVPRDDVLFKTPVRQTDIPVPAEPAAKK